MDFFVDNIIEQFDIDQLKSILNDMSIVAWDRRMEPSRLSRWLNNFDGHILGNKSVEQTLAAWILMNFTFYTENEVRALCKCIFDEYIHIKLIEYKNTNTLNNHSYVDKINHIIDNTLFFPLGNPSESGTSILYYFRQENMLSKKHFEPQTNKIYENVVYIDDVTISGSQAANYINNISVKGIKKYILMLISTDETNDYFIKVLPEHMLISAIVLDKRSKCFSDDTFCFSGSNSSKLKAFAFKMCEGYGKELFNKSPLGFDNGQYIFGFYYNTPDNTLPIIWCQNEKWESAFRRYDKIYNRGEVNIHESKYL